MRGATGIRVATLAAALAVARVAAPAACPDVDRNADGVVTVGVLGDSNTEDGWPMLATRSWVTRLAAHLRRTGAGPPVRFVNAAVGATVASGDSPRPGVVRNGPQQLAGLLRRGDVDVVVVALGTNDLYYARRPDSALSGRTPADAWHAIAGLVAAGRGAGAPVLVATVPPRYDDAALAPAIGELNRLLAAGVPRRELIDFTTRFAPRFFLPDGLHFTARGQQKRARRAGAALVRVLAGCPSAL